MRDQRSGERTTRRMDGKPRAERYRTLTPLAATIRFSISDLARFGGRAQIAHAVAVDDGRSSTRSNSSAPSSSPPRLQPSGELVLQREPGAPDPATRAIGSGAGPDPSSHAATAL